jgi:hypothetical protein
LVYVGAGASVVIGLFHWKVVRWHHLSLHCCSIFHYFPPIPTVYFDKFKACRKVARVFHWTPRHLLPRFANMLPRFLYLSISIYIITIFTEPLKDKLQIWFL